MKNWKSYAVTAGVTAVTLFALNTLAGTKVPVASDLARMITGTKSAAKNS